MDENLGFKTLAFTDKSNQWVKVFSSTEGGGTGEGKKEIQKFEYLENENSFLDEIK